MLLCAKQGPKVRTSLGLLPQWPKALPGRLHCAAGLPAQSGLSPISLSTEPGTRQCAHHRSQNVGHA
jgi:hypothetical protein